MGKMRDTKGITLISLVVTIIVLIILAAVSISLVLGENGLIQRTQKAAEEYQNAQKKEQEELEGITGEIDEITNSQYNKTKGINEPKVLTGMTPIKFTEPTDSTEGTTVKTNSTDAEWYDYDSKKWANTQTQDGSMWVWIPRYAYRINSASQTTEIVFLIGTTDKYYDESGNLQTAKRATSENEVVDTKVGYTVHPAFTNESSINYANGGWDKELTGIWVAKFEAGYAGGNNTAEEKASSVNYSQTSVWGGAIETAGGTADGTISARNWQDEIYGSTVTSIKYPTFQGLTYSMNYINHNDAFKLAKALTESGNIYGLKEDNTDSHLIKNSEWGAVAYLSQSKYGLNGTNIYKNNVTLNSSTSSVYAVTGVCRKNRKC